MQKYSLHQDFFKVAAADDHMSLDPVINIGIVWVDSCFIIIKTKLPKDA